jgi:hypothetical protein
MPTQANRITDRLENRPRRVSARRVSVIGVLIASGLMLSGCAGSFLDRTSSSDEMADQSWNGPMKPRTSKATFMRNGAQPILPPVPDDTSGLAPIKVSGLID